MVINKSDQMKYYEGRFELMAKSVKSCDIIEMLELKDFFIQEANTRMAGIDDQVMERIKYYTRKFKDNCKCMKGTS